jgi:hypothetical protein
LTEVEVWEAYANLNKEELSLCSDKGYQHFYKPDHPLARKNGMVPLHRHVMSVHLGRWLRDDEAVFFINGNRSDVRIENLKIVSNADLITINRGHTTPPVELICNQCGKPFSCYPSLAQKRQYCSPACVKEAKGKLTISPEELARLVWEMPTTQLAEMLGVSDKAIEKRCRKFGIDKPPRGYWAKLYAGQVDPIVYAEKSER